MRGISRTAPAIGLSIAILTASCSPSGSPGVEDSNAADGGDGVRCSSLWYRNYRDSCSPVVSTSYTDTCEAKVAAFEGDVGHRVAGYEGFSGGIIVTFQDGIKIPLWTRQIDCADPPFNPLKGWQPPQGVGGGVGVEPSPVDASPEPVPVENDISSPPHPPTSSGEPLAIPVGQAHEPWLTELRSRQQDFCDDRPILRRTPSLDGNFEYLEVCSWATSNDILQRRLSDGRLKEVGEGSNIKIVRVGPWRGFLLADRHHYHQGGGSYDATFVIRPDGREMFEVPGSRADPKAVSSWLGSRGWAAD